MPDSDKLGSPQFDTAQPTYTADPREGDNHLRDVKQRLYNWATREHNVDGKHKVPIGAGTPTADATALGQLAIKTGTYNELWCNVSGAFEQLTSRGSIATLQVADTSHAASIPIDHAAGSIRRTHILGGEIRKDHLDGLGDTSSIANLVNGLNADALHVHAFDFSPQLSTYTASGTYQIPTGARFLLIEAWSKGGNSSGGNNINGAGGGGGYARVVLAISGETTLPYYVESSYTALHDLLNITAGANASGATGGAGGIVTLSANVPLSPRLIYSFGANGGTGGDSGYRSGGSGGACGGPNGTIGGTDFGATQTNASNYGCGYGGEGGDYSGNTPGADGGFPGGGGGGQNDSRPGQVAYGASGKIQITAY